MGKEKGDALVYVARSSAMRRRRVYGTMNIAGVGEITISVFLGTGLAVKTVSFNFKVCNVM